jgi:hypothetical protein
MIERNGQLAAAIREVKNAAADRDDVVIEMREAERMRLELLAAELAPMIAEVPQDVDLFDFAISSGLQPRFWIDAVSFVGMGRDKRTFRFVRDTRLGRVVLAESSDVRETSRRCDVSLRKARRLKTVWARRKAALKVKPQSNSPEASLSKSQRETVGFRSFPDWVWCFWARSRQLWLLHPSTGIGWISHG